MNGDAFFALTSSRPLGGLLVQRASLAQPCYCPVERAWRRIVSFVKIAAHRSLSKPTDRFLQGELLGSDPGGDRSLVENRPAPHAHPAARSMISRWSSVGPPATATCPASSAFYFLPRRSLSTGGVAFDFLLFARPFPPNPCPSESSVVTNKKPSPWWPSARPIPPAPRVQRSGNAP